MFPLFARHPLAFALGFAGSFIVGLWLSRRLVARLRRAGVFDTDTSRLMTFTQPLRRVTTRTILRDR